MANKNEFIQDIRGQVCPSSLLIALRCANEHQRAILDDGMILKILTDSRDAIVTIPNALSNMGFSTKFEKKQEGYYELSITRNIEE